MEILHCAVWKQTVSLNSQWHIWQLNSCCYQWCALLVGCPTAAVLRPGRLCLRRGGGPRITSIVWFLVVWKDEVPYRGVIPVWKGKASEYRALPDCSSALKCLHTVSTGSIRIWSQWKCIPGACCFGVSWWIQTKSPCGLCPDAGPAAPSLPRMVQGHQPALWHTALTCTSGMNSAATSPPMLPNKENSPRFLDKGFSPSIRAM